MSVIVPNASPSKTMTMASFNKIGDREAAIRKLERIAAENLHNTLRLLRHNRASDIKVYRFSSKLIPLATHQDLRDWDPFQALAADFAEVGNYVKANGMRVSFHLDHFTVLSTFPARKYCKAPLTISSIIKRCWRRWDSVRMPKTTFISAARMETR
jgi:UV DNA damage endonuclease